jgi:integrase
MDIEASELRDGGRLKDIRAFIDRLFDHALQAKRVGSLAAATLALNQTVCAHFASCNPQTVPVNRAHRRLVLSADEVVRFLEAVPSLKCRAALTTAYAAGLCASEVASL